MLSLEPEIQKYFWRRFRKKAAIFSNFQDFLIPNDSLVELVLYSDGRDRIQDLHLLPSNLKYRYWVLSRYSKNVLLKKSGLKPAHIHVIPRYELFPIKKPMTRLTNKNKPLKLIYSGRTDCLGKNFHLACALASEIQAQWKARVEFHVCGPNLMPNLVASELLKYKWKTEPKLWNDLGRKWINKFKTGTLINLSTFLGEDFGVSVAQAQQKGFSLIISDWGGHKDVIGANVIKISVRAINKANSERKIREQGKILSKEFLKAIK